MIGKILSSSTEGIDGHLVTVETSIYKRGLPRFNIIGLPDNALKESKDRAKSAILNSQFQFPKGVITVNLAPASLKKTGAVFDLAIAISVLKTSGQIKDFEERDSLFLGELSLDGLLRPITGILPMVIQAQKIGIKNIFLPEHNSKEASIIDKINIIPVKNLEEVMGILNQIKGKNPIPKLSFQMLKKQQKPDKEKDFSNIAGQYEAKRALEIAAAGQHNILFIGPPGSGKTMLSSRIPSILPELSFDEALETTKLYSSRGLLNEKKFFITKRPFRNPHHSSSEVALIGGGSNIKCGEISLAHNGVLFLDEFPEFNKNVIQALREPLENHAITISRASGTITYPANILLVAAMNPCPCGFLGDEKRECVCSSLQIQKYYQKLSGPILDRIDIHINVPRVDVTQLNIQVKKDNEQYTSALMKARITKAVKRQKERFGGGTFKYNSKLSNEEVFEFCKLDSDMQKFLNTSIEKLGLSLRAYFKILKLARTIADLNEEKDISIYHLSEAIQYRLLDRYNNLYSVSI